MASDRMTDDWSIVPSFVNLYFVDSAGICSILAGSSTALEA
jgi:hypothetical protein